MFFASDNSGPAPQQVLDALAEANQGYALGYGADALMDEVRDRIRTLFEAPDAAVYLVSTGSAANALSLATLVNPYDTIFCAKLAHIDVDECNAPEFYTGGAKLTLVGDQDRMSPDALRAAIVKPHYNSVHGAQRGAVSITQATEFGNIYDLDHLGVLCETAKAFDLPVHLDGARFSNAVAALACTAADMTWKAGVDVAVFGGTKNGLLGVEAVVIFDPAKAWEFELRRKRGGHLLSKHRYLSAQMAAYLRDGLWLDLAMRSNAITKYLLVGLQSCRDVTVLNDAKVNMIFFEAPRALHQRLMAAGAVYDLPDGLDGDADALVTGRLVCDWSKTEAEIDAFLEVLTAQ